MDNIDRAVLREYGRFDPIGMEEAIVEQRQVHRYPMPNEANIAFYNNCTLYRGFMMDISTRGACLLLSIADTGKLPELSINRNMECYIFNRHGNSKCRGTVKWIKRDDKWLRWGISFIEVSDHEDDPVRKLMVEVSRRHVTVPVMGTAIY